MSDPNASDLRTLIERYADPFKGLLVLVVVADHNDWFRKLAPDLFRPLTFHVLGFLMLAFAFSGRPLTMTFLRDRVCRYLVPFWWMLALTSSLYFVLVLHSDDAVGQLGRSIVAAAWGNAPFVKEATGFIMLWYLPCMFGLTVVLAALRPWLPGGGRGTWATAALWSAAFAAHMFLPLLPTAWGHSLPMGLGITAQVLLIGLVFMWLLPTQLGLVWWLGVALATVWSYAALAADSVNLEIATLELVGIDRPLLLLQQDAAGLGGVLLILGLARRLSGVRWLSSVGRHSLLVYLLHPLAYHVMSRLPCVPLPQGLQGTTLFFVGLVAGAAAAAMAWGASCLVHSLPTISAWLVPRGWADWPPTAYVTKRVT